MNATTKKKNSASSKTNKFYMFRQNNPGGSFTFNAKEGIGINVIIEATSAKEANDKAESIGIYFNGCDRGIDCDCCGDRWYTCDEDEGEETPKVYGTSPQEYVKNAKCTWGGKKKDEPEVSVHYTNGKILNFFTKKKP
jgi:hypothetical protein